MLRHDHASAPLNLWQVSEAVVMHWYGATASPLMFCGSDGSGSGCCPGCEDGPGFLRGHLIRAWAAKSRGDNDTSELDAMSSYEGLVLVVYQRARARWTATSSDAWPCSVYQTVIKLRQVRPKGTVGSTARRTRLRLHQHRCQLLRFVEEPVQGIQFRRQVVHARRRCWRYQLASALVGREERVSACTPGDIQSTEITSGQRITQR